jgi:hypothetical protein
MKTFKHLLEETLYEGHDRYPGDEMTKKELKIAINAAKNILDMIEDGASVMRWQISAIVKASEELASVCTSMRADEEEDEYEEEEEWDEYDSPFSMYGEEVELDENYNDREYIRRAIPALKNAVEFHKDLMKVHDKKSVKGSSEYVKAHSAAAKAHKEAAEKHLVAHAQLSAGSKDIEYYVKPARELGAYAEKLSGKANKLSEELDEAEGSKRKNRELFATGRIEKDEFDRRMGYGKYKKKGPRGVGPLGSSLYKNLVTSPVKNEELDFKVSVDGLPDMYVKGKSPSEVKTKLRKVIRKPDSIQSVDRVTQAVLKKIFRDKATGKEDIQEGYHDPIHREHISNVVHDYVPKTDQKHDKIVDHLHKAKSFGAKTADSLESHASISIGSAKRITKAVADHLKANFGSPSKTQTQAQRVDRYLKQKWVKPR